MVLFLISILRVAVAATDTKAQVQAESQHLRLSITKQRRTIFDSNLIPITNSNKKIIAAVSPTPRAITAISAVLEGDQLKDVLERLKGGKPILCEVPEYISCDGIVCTTVFDYSSSDELANHLIGYTDNSLNGISGLEKAYNAFLYTESEVSVLYECNGKGDILEGTAPKLENDTSIEASGLVTTLDINIQNIAENASKNLEVGAVVVADAKNGKIRASVSRPCFDSKNISQYLNYETSPLLNRAVNPYNVGSVFKPCVAIAGISKSLSWFCHNCKGSTKIIDRIFKCHKYDGHGYMNLRTALANSCNTYFYNFAIKIGKDEIYKTALNLRFGKKLKLAENFYTHSGNMPNVQTLNNNAQLANFSIGQGELLLSPISMLPLYCSIASNGSYYIPSVVEGTLENGSFSEYDIGSPTKVTDEKTAEILRRYLTSVLTEGTGETAMPKTVSAAGKTATAQTGKYQNGVEICQGWFCGFFPAENPQYVVIVFSEDTTRQNISCGEIFAQIADGVYGLKSTEK